MNCVKLGVETISFCFWFFWIVGVLVNLDDFLSSHLFFLFNAVSEYFTVVGTLVVRLVGILPNSSQLFGLCSLLFMAQLEQAIVFS